MSSTWITALLIAIIAALLVILSIVLLRRPATPEPAKPRQRRETEKVLELIHPSFNQTDEELAAANAPQLTTRRPDPAPQLAEWDDADDPQAADAPPEQEHYPPASPALNGPETTVVWGLQLIGLSIGPNVAHLSWRAKLRNGGAHPVNTLYLSGKIAANRPGKVLPEDIIMPDFQIDSLHRIDPGSTATIDGIWEFPASAMVGDNGEEVHLYADVQVVAANVSQMRQSVAIGHDNGDGKALPIATGHTKGIITGLIARPPEDARRS